ncbi:MAG: amino acid adenylation domain-containing protein [Vulcanimicrobiota bacterium]
MSIENYTKTVTDERNDTEAEFPEHATLHGLFEEQVTIHPERMAAQYHGASLTFDGLNRRANRVAHLLLRQCDRLRERNGDVTIGICLERSLELVVAIVAVLKAGAAYMPLDSEYPEERLRFMVNDSETPVVLTSRTLRERFPYLGERGRAVLALDDREALRVDIPDHNPSTQVTPSDCAYVIYTSGSTGAPKGAVLEHRGVVNRLLWMQKEYQLTEHDRIFQKTPYSFDVSVWEFIWPLITGSALCFARPQGHKDPRYLMEEVQQYGITTMHFVPSMLRAFLSAVEIAPEEERFRLLSTLRLIFASGEGLPTALAAECQRLIPQAALHNLYGPTEASIDVTYWDCRRSEHRDCPVVTIGHPIDNIRLYVLDEEMNPVPPGSPGELYLSGVGLARGYLNRPELTAERFVPNPFFSEGDREWYRRIYKTGDLVRLLPDGAVEYLGRTDFQVKLRGFRVELGEIEAVLTSHKSIREAVVTAVSDEAGQHLVAYYVIKDEEKTEVRPGELHRHVAGRLPAYMIPSFFVRMDSFPLTSSGKVDRKALPAPDRNDRAEQAEFVAPRNSLEEDVASIWQEVLKCETPGVFDSFFSLGGHSLSAMQVITRMEERFSFHCPIEKFFGNPTVSGLSQLVSEKGKDRVVVAASIEKVDRRMRLPLSFAQQRLWFLYRYEDTNRATYNIPMAFRIKGHLDLPALEKSLNYLIERHESLRTVFLSDSEGAWQEVRSPAEARLTLTAEPIRLSDILGGLMSEEEIAELAANTDTERLVECFCTEEANSPFSLESGPLFRALLFRVSSLDHVLMINHHHIVTDGWSIGILLRELQEAYTAFRSGASPEPLPLPVQYADYASWQRNEASAPRFADNVAYWQNALSGYMELDLPTDRIRPRVKTYHGDLIRFTIDEDTLRKVRNLSGETGTTLFMVLLAAWSSLLSRYTRQDDIIIGAPIAGRTRKELEPLIGFFVNTLPLRTDLSGNPSFREVLARVRKTCLDAFEHQEVPFEHLVDLLKVERDPGRTPLFSVAFVLQNATDQESDTTVRVFNDHLPFRLPDTDISDVPFHYRVAKFDLTLSLDERPGEISAELEFNSDLFYRATVERMAAHFSNLLSSAVREPGIPVTSLSFLGEEEKRTILVDWNRTDCPYPEHATIDSLFNENADARHNDTAVVFQGLSITYGDLHKYSNLVAHELIRLLSEKGGGSESESPMIGICLPRSIIEIAAVVAIIKAGAAYVPLDPDYPRERLDFMLEDTGLSVIITSEALFEALPFLADNGRSVIVIDRDFRPTDKRLFQPLEVRTSPDSCAYVIYTSGSTGTPKGVMIDHRSVVRLVKSQNYLRIRPEDVVAHASNICFDAATFEVWGALLNGARLEVITKDTMLSPMCLKQAFREGGVTICFFTTALFQILADRHADLLNSLRVILFGGEEVNTEKVRHFLAAKRHETALYHVYGPTETTTFATFCILSDKYRKSRVLPIGRALAGKRLFVLDPAMSPVPMGIPGELYIGGIGTATGYLKRPELTREKFVQNPFAGGLYDVPVRDTRIYRTGDLVRWLPDGTIEFLARTDFQVKIRGFRIELGEIETVLSRHESVDQCLVIVHRGENDKSVVAYFTVKDAGKEPTPSELKAFLKESLPDYMVPSYFISVPEIPLTPNGKVDRRALPPPKESDTQEMLHVPPVTKEEHMLADIWQEILGVKRIGITDDFFALGGHSLSATRIIAMIEEECGVTIPLKAIFSHPDIASLAPLIAESSRGAESRDLTISPVPRDMPLPLSFAQERIWFLNLFEGGQSATYNIPMAFRLRGFLRVDYLEKSFTLLVERHESLRTVFDSGDGEPRQVILAPYRVSLMPERVDEKSLRELLSSEAMEPFDLSRGPLFRVRLLQTADEEYVFIVVWHHIISDGWSIAILFRELSALYNGFLLKNKPHLAPLPFHYADYAQCQRMWLKSGAQERQLSYWKIALDGIQSLELPTDHPRPPSKTFTGRRHKFFIDSTVAGGLTEFARRCHSTLFMVFLSSLSVLLGMISGQDDIVIGSPVANRNHRDIDLITGFFVNTLALRCRLEGDPAFSDLVSQVRSTCLQAYENQDVPFEQVVEALGVPRDLARTPVFQVFFALQHGDDLPLPRLNFIDLQPLDTGYHVAKFDLTFSFVEEEAGLAGEIEYNTDLFEEHTVAQMASSLIELLHGVIVSPDKKISDFPLMPGHDEAHVLYDWNAAPEPSPDDRSVVDLFLERARVTPEANAAVAEGNALSYSELEERSKALALHIRKKYKEAYGRDMQPDTPIGICFQRSTSLVTSVMAVLRAGGAYLPLDPLYPAERLSFMLDEARCPLVLTKRSLLEEKPFLAGESRQVLCTDELEKTGVSCDEALPHCSSGSLAYVIYTSGSTGKPKGVMVEHHALMNMALAKQQELSLMSEDRVAQFVSISFDVSVSEIIPTLTAGASLYIVPELCRHDLEALIDFYEKQGITVATIPAAVLKALPRRALPSLRAIITGGSLCDEDTLMFWSSSRKLFNEYGPTESAVFSSYALYNETGRADVIGKPIQNVTCYVLDKALHPLPPGLPGELFIGGESLARGYVARPDLTAMRFTGNPFATTGEREAGRNTVLYRTGDRVTWRPDGTIRFLGRNDFQVKIRGFRVELAEIEAVLDRQPGVESSVVLALQGKGEPRLAAYYVGESARPGLREEELRQALARELPDYMVPSAYVCLDSMPLTSSGKVDRNALPLPEETGRKGSVMPRNDTEKALAAIWKEALSVEEVGVDDNFFSLGGHSLLVTRVVTQINRALGSRLEVMSLFSNPTIASLAPLLEKSTGTEQGEKGFEEGEI